MPETENNSSFIIGWNERTSPYKFEIKRYVGEEETLEEARKDAQEQLRKAMSSEGLI